MSATVPSAGCWPTPRQRLLLQAATLPTRRAHEAWIQWITLGPLDRVPPLESRLLSWMHPRVEELEIGYAPRRVIEAAYRENWLRNELLFNRCFHLISQLQAVGIQPVLLKGAAVTLSVIRDSGIRYMEDFDLLVPEHEADAVIRILIEAGWQPLMPEKVSRHGRSLRHSHEFVHKEGYKCDLHWRLLHQGYKQVSEAPLWNWTSTVLWRNQPAFVLSPELQLLHTCVHGLAWEAIPPIRWILDASLILRMERDLNWDLFLVEAERRKVVIPALEALKYMETFFESSIPQWVIQSLNDAQVSWLDFISYYETVIPYHQSALAYRIFYRIRAWVGGSSSRAD